ncbi:MAG: APC family permease [Halopenitus sp.]
MGTEHADGTGELGLAAATAIGVGTMIAAGIFVLSGIAVANVGVVAVGSFVIAALVASITALAYAEFSTIYPENGGAYIYVYHALEGEWTYLVGWAMIFGYPASAAFYLLSFAHWLRRFLYPIFGIPGWIPGWTWGVGVFLVIVAVNVVGVKETGVFQVVLTALKIVLICVFLYGGLQAWQTAVLVTSFAEHATAFGRTLTTASLVFITFFGFEAIATSAGEIRNPVKNVPRAIFVSIASVTVLYALVVVAVVLAVNDAAFVRFLLEHSGLTDAANVRTFLAEHGELVMGHAAWYFLGRVGFYVIVAGALVSMVSAANATVLAGSRVKQAMARREQLPPSIGSRHPSFGTPLRAVLLTGAIGLGFLLVFGVLFAGDSAVASRVPFLGGVQLGVEALAHLADFMLLAGLVGVNVALVYSRRKRPDVERGFRVPLVPWLPALGATANLLLLANVQFASLLLGLAIEAVGFVLWHTRIAESGSSIRDRFTRN